MTQSGYLLLGLTAFVALLVAVVAFSALRFVAAARDTKRHLREGGGEVTILSAALQDAVVKLKAQERAMSARAAASEQLSSQIVESLTAGLLVVDLGGRTEILNPAGRRMLDVGGEAVGLDYRELLARVAPLVSVIKECLTTPRPIIRRELEIVVAGRASRFGVTVSPLGGGESPRGVICLFSDLTTVVELEEQLRLKESLAQLGELTAGIAHEFRNGLATIHGYAHLMDPRELPDAYRPYVATIREETEVLGQVVTDFLNFARPTQAVFSPVDMAALVAAALAEARQDAPLTDIAVRGDFGTIDGDEVLLRQMMVNLIRNGIEACGAGVTPSIVVEGRLDRTHRVCRLSVQDNGPGIQPPLRERVFRPFFTTKPQGTGLGLAVVQKVVVTHNGRIAIGSSPLGGASIEMMFPLTDVEAGPQPPPRPA